MSPILRLHYRPIRKIIAVLIALGCAGCTVPQQRLGRSSIWRLVANSQYIVIGTLHSPTEEILACAKSKDHKYVDIRVDVEKCLKSVSERNIQVSYYTKPKPWSPHPEKVMKFDNKKAILFMKRLNGGPPIRYFFASRYGNKLLQVFDVATVAAIKKEIAEQARIIQSFNKLFPPGQEQLYSRVKTIIDDIVDSEMSRPPKRKEDGSDWNEKEWADGPGWQKQEEKQEDGFLKLEKLGWGAVPSIIMLMDDRRPLPIRCIDLRNPPWFFEGYRSYGPELAVDALHCILEQIADETHGHGIHSGGSEKQRRDTVNAWKIYLYHLKQDPYRRKSPSWSRGASTWEE